MHEVGLLGFLAMKLEPVMEELEAAAGKLGIKVSYEVFSESLGGGGLCKVKGAFRIIIDKRSTTGEKVAMLAKSLATFDLESIFLTPATREIVDKYQTGSARP